MMAIATIIASEYALITYEAGIREARSVRFYHGMRDAGDARPGEAVLNKHV